MIVGEEVRRWVVLSVLIVSLVGVVVRVLIGPLVVLKGRLAKASRSWDHRLLRWLLKSVSQIVQIF